MTDTTAPFAPVSMVYLGHRESTKDYLLDAFKLLDESELLSDKTLYFKADRRQGIIGGVYCGLEWNGETVKGLKTRRYVKRWEDASKVMEWEAESEAADMAKKRAKLEADEKAQSVIERTVLPLRELMTAMRARGQYGEAHALREAVIRALDRPVRAK